MTGDINVIAIVKGLERYVWLYDDASAVAAIRAVCRYAANPELSFTWDDASVVSGRIRQQYVEGGRRF